MQLGEDLAKVCVVSLRERMSLPATICAIVGRLKDSKFKGLTSESKALTKLRAMSTLSSRQ